ncbi:MAG: ABC transporter substrate-binding protein [Candidatus Baldrarchaeia archaeon]
MEGKNVTRILLMVIFTITLVLPLLSIPSAMALQQSTITAQSSEPGPAVDKITVGITTSQETGIGDVAAGRIDIFLWAAPPTAYVGMSAEQLENIVLIRSASGYWSLLFNPAYNKTLSEEHGTVIPLMYIDGKWHFNPFALKKVRYAMQFLVNRKYIVDEILAGGGAPMYSPVMSSEPSAPRFLEVYEKHGLTPTGDLAKALEMIDEAMNETARILSEKELGTLEKRPADDAPAGYWWYFNDEPVVVKFYIRIEDERLEEGRYIADLIEQAGIKVERLERDRWTCIQEVYLSDPADLKWHIYTEGWVAMASWAYPEWSIAQMYAPWVGWMPGIQVEGWWQYENSTIDEITIKLCTGQVPNETIYWEYCKKAVDIGIEESVRVFVCETWEFFPVHTAVTNLVFDQVAGLWTRWSLITANTSTGVLSTKEFSAAGALFMSAWNPVGGFQDVYSEILWRVIRDFGSFASTRGEPTQVRTTWTVKTNYEFDTEGNLIGKIEVPADAVVYNPVKEQWVNVGSGKTAAVEVRYSLKLGNWHYSALFENWNAPAEANMSMADVKYWIAFWYEWASNDSATDKFYDKAIAEEWQPILDTIKGFKFFDNGTVVVWGDYVHPVSRDVIADYYATFAWPPVPWELLDAMSWVVAYGGNVTDYEYSWDGSKGEWIDMLNPNHVLDLRKLIEEMKNEGYIPVPISEDVTLDVAKVRYELFVNFTDTFGHAVISNGPFYLARWEPGMIYLELHAFRDPSYPFTADYWYEKMKISIPVIAALEVPAEVTAGEDAIINITVTIDGQPAPNGTYVYVRIRNSTSSEIFYEGNAKYVSEGKFRFIIPANVTKEMPEGSTWMVDVLVAEKEGAFPVIRWSAFAVVAAPPPPPPPAEVTFAGIPWWGWIGISTVVTAVVVIGAMTVLRRRAASA